MELRALEVGVAIARHRSFTRAAEAVGMSQPAVSRLVKTLERDLGVRLFERTTRRVVPTEEGSVFVERAERLLADLEALSRDMHELSAGRRGLVRLGAWLSLNPGLSSLIAEFLKKNQDVDITIREANSPEMLEMLRSRELDVAIATMNPDLELQHLEHRVCVEEPFLLIVPPESPLAHRHSVTLRDIADTPLIMHKSGSSIRRLIEHAFSASGRTPHVIVETNETSSARRLVAQGIGAGIVPRSVAAGPGPKVCAIRLAPVVTRRAVLVWRRDVHDQAVNGFVRHVLAQPMNALVSV